MLTLTSPHRTWAHGLPAGGKLAALAALTMVLFVPLPGWGGLALGLGLAGAVAGLAGSLRLLRPGLRMLRPLWPFAVLVLVWDGFAGVPLVGLAVVLRMATAVTAANLVTMTTSLSQMQAVFLWLARPFAALVPPKALALAMALVVRFLPVMLEREARLREAWAARSPKRPRWRLMMPVTLAALDDAERVAEALRARGGAG